MTSSLANTSNQAAAGPRRKTSIMTRWPTEENPSTVFRQEVHPVAAPAPHWLPPVDYDDDEEEEDVNRPATVTNNQRFNVDIPVGDDRSLEFQQQQASLLEERQMRRKISISNITGKVKIPSRRRSVIELSADFQQHAATAAAAGSVPAGSNGLAPSRPRQQTVPE